MQEVLYSKLQRLKEEVKYLGDHKEEFVRTLKISTETRKIVERTVYLCAEIVLDIADLLILKKGYPKPSTYSDSIFKLGDYRIVPKDFASKFVYIAGIMRIPTHSGHSFRSKPDTDSD